jgi:tetratricopeptide (TPR) repeat protein
MLQQRELSERLLAVALRLTGAQNARVWKAWGDAALYQHDPTRAIARYQRAIELNETSAEAYLAMAQAFSLQNNSVAAESALDAARRLQGAPSESRE